MVEVNSLMKFNDSDNPHNKHPSQCLYEFDNYIRKQDHFNADVMKQFKYNSDMIARLSDLLLRIINDVRGVGKHASMVQTQLEQVAKSQRELLDEMNHNMHDFVVRVATRGGKMTQEPLYPEGHPKRIEQDSQINNTKMKLLSQMLKLNLVMNTHLAIMKNIMMRFMKTLNQTMKKN